MRSKILKEINTLVTLNDEQRKAIETVEGNLLIIASAGTGKTTTIVERYVNLVHNHGYLPSQIMMTTFTNKAAKDMVRKIYERTGREPPYVGTMHSLFLKILRKHADYVKLVPGFTLIHEDNDKRKIIRRLLAREGLPDKKDEIAYFQNWIGKFKNRGILAEKLSETYSLDDNINEGIIEEALDDEIIHINPAMRRYVNKIYKLYEQELRNQNSIDLDDILLLTYKLLNEHEDVRHQYQVKFKAIMVDEAQDLNIVQKNILNLLKNDNLCLIGDDCQNIYEWRGSSNDFIFDFSENENTVFLKDNYRSEKNIIDAVNKIIGSMKFKIDKSLNCTRTDGKGNVFVKSFYDSSEETDYLVFEIMNLIREGVPKDEIAVLFRTNRIGKEIEREFNKNRIPCHMAKTKDFMEREEVRDIISFLRLKANPSSLLDFQRILSLVNGIGDSTIKKFEIIAYDNKITLVDSLQYAEQLNPSLSPEKLSEISRLEEALKSEGADPLLLFLYNFGYESYLTRKYFVESEKLNDKIENIAILKEMFADAVGEYVYEDEIEEGNKEGDADSEKENKVNTSDEFSEPVKNSGMKVGKDEINKFLDSLINLDKHAKTKDKVVLSTIHSAKGLEWSHVFVVGCNERTLPFYTSRELSTVKRDSELRLFYVALSRAKKSLTLTHYDYNPWGNETAPSQFLNILGVEEDHSHRDHGSDWDEVQWIDV